MDIAPASIGLASVVAGLIAAVVAVCWAIAELRARRRAESGLMATQALIEAYLTAKATAETRLAAAEAAAQAFAGERERAAAALESERRLREDAERRAALADQARLQMERTMTDWAAVRAQTLDATKAALLETSTTLSSKLLEDHKREAEAAKKENEEIVKKTTDSLTKGVQQLVEHVSSLNVRVEQSDSKAETILRALSNPAGAGQMAEVGLNNTLETFGLIAGRDFLLQHTIDGSEDGARLRPDAVVFLPGQSVLTIDCKASKHLLEIAEAEGTERERDTYARLAATMNQHLRALAGKDYASAYRETCRKAGKGERVNRAINIMYLPSEVAVERLAKADPEFMRKAAREQIVVCGPTGLMAYVGFASCEIDLGRRAENQEQIVAGAERLIEAIGVVMSHVNAVGRGIRTAADSHVKMVKSINGRLLPRGRELTRLGVRLPRGKELPPPLPAFQVFDADDAVIDGESEDVTPAAALVDESARG
jgi:DNA recombination protein RmuC